jgi:hypothetical protein
MFTVLQIVGHVLPVYSYRNTFHYVFTCSTGRVVMKDVFITLEKKSISYKVANTGEIS